MQNYRLLHATQLLFKFNTNVLIKVYSRLFYFLLLISLAEFIPLSKNSNNSLD